MFKTKNSTAQDILNIDVNQYMNLEKEYIIKCMDSIKLETLLNGDEVVAVILFKEFHPRFFVAGTLIKKDIKISELIELKKTVKNLIIKYNCDYVYSECVTCPVRDRFHEFLGFEVERDMDTFKKWKFKGLLY